MAVRRVDDDRIDAGAYQRLDAFLGALAHTDRRTDAQLALGIARGIGETGLLGDVLDGDQALEFEGIVDHQQALQLVPVQQRLGLQQRRAIGHGDELFARRHDVADGNVVAGLEPQVAPCHDADHLAAVAHGEPGHTQLLRKIDDLAHRVAGGDDHRVAQHTRFIALYTRHLGRLVARGEVLVDDADSAFLRDGDGQARLGDRVHGGRHQGEVQRDVAGEAGAEGSVLGKDLGVRWHQQHIVEGQRFAEQAHVEAPNGELYPWPQPGLRGTLRP